MKTKLLLTIAALNLAQWSGAQTSCGASVSPLSATICQGDSIVLNAYVPSVFNGQAGYCTSEASSAADGEIVQVKYSSFVQSSTCTTTGGPAANGLPASVVGRYSNYTTVSAGQMLKGASTDVIVSFTNCSNFSFGCGAAIFIDLDQNGSFSASERLATRPSAAIAVSPLVTIDTMAVSIPASALSGTTLMRVITRESTDGANIAACGTYTWGETEDYAVIIGDSIVPNPSFGAYSINWSPASSLTNASSKNPTAFPASTTTYTLVVTGLNGLCTDTLLTTITLQPNTLVLSATTMPQDQIPANGTCSVAVTGGSAPYTYSWAPTGGSTAQINGLTAGTYTCTITDANGCTRSTVCTVSSLLSVQSVSESNGLQMFPGSYSGQFTLVSSDLNLTQVQFMNIHGQRIYSLKRVNAQNVMIDCQNWPAGIYIAHGDNGSKRRFVVAH
jgi:hypothetical protein